MIPLISSLIIYFPLANICILNFCHETKMIKFTTWSMNCILTKYAFTFLPLKYVFIVYVRV